MSDKFSEFSFPVADFGKGGSSHSIHCYQWSPDTPSSTELPVLCVHGLSRNGRDFDHLAEALSDTRTVLAVDMPGRGKSDYLSEPESYNYPAYVAQIDELLKYKNIQKLDWVGTSMGGIIAMMFAAIRPGVINRLILNDIGCIVSADGLKRILTNAGSDVIFPTRKAAEEELKVRCATFGITDDAHWQHLFTHSIIDLPDGTSRFAYDPGILSTLTSDEEIQDIDLWTLWPSLENIPMLLLRGAQSDILTDETAKKMQEQHKNLTYNQFEGVGHVPSLMDAQQITLIKEWMNQTQNSQGEL